VRSLSRLSRLSSSEYFGTFSDQYSYSVSSNGSRYRPPVRFEQHSFYMMTNCAVVMALDLGLGRPTTQHAMSLGIRHNQPNANSIEARRAFLVCYYLSMSITMVLRRPILLRWTEFMEESVIALETSSEAYPSDRVLCHHVKLANIGQHVSIAFQMDNPCAQIDIANPEVIQDIKVFETELGTLRQKRPVDVGDRKLPPCLFYTVLIISSCRSTRRARDEPLSARNCLA
jgi:hypothetical protein